MEKKWTESEIQFLKENYANGSNINLLNTLNKTWSGIQNKAFKLKLKRNVANANAINLLNKTNESYYWLGFIMADGHFSKTKQLQINLGDKDLSHLKKFAKFVGYKDKLIKPSISINIDLIYNELKNEFSISNIKTYEPCSLSKLNGDALFSFIIGFIDGDGHITEKGYLKIKCHSSWINNLNIMVSYLTNDDYHPAKLNSEGLALVGITKIEYMKSIKQKVIDLKLPMLDRKWDRINFIKLSKTEKHLTLKNKCFELFESGLLPKTIIKMDGFKRDFTYRMFNEYKNI